jgi:hypothetical protein
MSYTYLQEQGAESSAECFLDIPRSVLSRLSLTAEKCSCSGSETESCRSFQSGMTCERSTASHGADLSMSSAAGFHAKTSVQQEKGRESTANGQGSGPTWQESLTKYDPVSRSWRIRQCSFLAGLDEFSETWPKWGMTRDGASYRLPTPVLRTCERGSGYWRTPSAREPGVSVERLVAIEGGELGGMNRHFDKQTGRMAQIGLTQQVKARAMWPTPRVVQAKFPGPNGHKGNYLLGEVLIAEGLIGNASHSQQTATTTECALFADSNTPTSANALDRLRTVTNTTNETESCTPDQFPTPKSRDWKGQTQRGIYGPMDSVANLDRGDGKPIGGSLNPNWVEWLMGWPIGQTDLKPLGTGKFRQWWHSHGGF